MPLPTSGAISLDQMHVEAGGSSGTNCAINNTDIRGLIGKSSGATMSFDEWHGASSSLDSITVTVGIKPALHALYAGPWYGYHSSGSYGSASKTSVAWNSGASYNELNAAKPGIYAGQYQLRVSISGGAFGNSGWTSMTVGGSTYSRTSFNYGSSPSGQYWNLNVGYTSPYGTTAGATRLVVFN